MQRKIGLVVMIALTLVIAACGQASLEKKEKTVKIGYFPNLTHVATIVGLEKGYFKEAFGEEVEIETKTVNNGGLFMEAMATGAIDVGTVGPGPLLNHYVKDPNYFIISGAVNGGAVLVGSKHSQIKELEDLDEKKIAIPVIGSTQDVMLRKTLNEVGLKPTTNGGTVELMPAAPADTATLFQQESVDATATQEPWGYILETQADGELILNWDEFAWGKDSTNTVVAATTDFKENDSHTKKYLSAHIKAVEFIKDNPDEAQNLVIEHIKDLTSKEIDKQELETAFDRLEVTTYVNESVIQEMADISQEAGYVESNNIDGLVDLSTLDTIK
ncbi:MAG TPA: ABC transporter substrate-binding protein [Pseudogracilibacillus sp.]|nr:ABC transporter substrate-binding protein [Pseudogracilibacillus sp.]